ncbi:MAG: peptidylprolyl isomerase [Pirellulaceae bacterium]
MTLSDWRTASFRILLVMLYFALPQTLERQSHSVEPGGDSGYALSEQRLTHPQTGAQVQAAVDSTPIYDVEVERYVTRLVGAELPKVEPVEEPEYASIYGEGPTYGPAERYRLAVIGQLIRRQIVLDYLQSSEFAATEQELDLAESQARQAMEARGETFENFLKSGKLDREMFRRRLAWNIAWTRYEEKYLTEDNLKRYFEQHRMNFDGTTRRVSQILLGDPSDPNHAWDESFHKASKLLRGLQRGNLDFAESAKRYSVAESAADGGDLGWLERYGQLPVTLHEAVFTARKGTTIGPLQTEFGVHLLMVVDERPGTKPWEEIRDEVRPAARRFLFNHTVDRHMPSVRVRYADQYSHMEADYFDPHLTSELEIFGSDL